MDDGSGCREIIWRSVNGAYVLERPIQGSSSVVDLCTAAMPRIASCVSGSSLSKAAAMSANSVSPGHDAGTRAARSMPIAGGLTQPLTSVCQPVHGRFSARVCASSTSSGRVSDDWCTE